MLKPTMAIPILSHELVNINAHIVIMLQIGTKIMGNEHVFVLPILLLIIFSIHISHINVKETDIIAYTWLCA